MKSPHESHDGASDSGVAAGLVSKRRNLEDDDSNADVDVDSDVAHHNQPVLMSVFQDPETMQEKVVVIAALPGGTENAEFTLVGPGPGTRTARIEYNWHKLAFDIEGIFAAKLKLGNMAKFHPMISALNKDLQVTRDHIDDTPRGVIELTLPISVQTAAKSFSHSGKKNKEDGSRVLVVELTAYQSSYTIKQEDKKIKFEEC